MIKKSKRTKKFPYAFVLPMCGYLALMTIFPSIFIVWTSLLDYNLYKGIFTEKFIGYSNYLTLFSNPEFWNSFRVLFIFTITSVGIELFLAIALTEAVFRIIKFQRIIILIILMPMVIAPAVTAWHWRFMYHDILGLISYVISRVTGTSPVILGSSTWALPALIIVDVWQWSSFIFLILFAGLLSLSPEPYEASLLDGASAWQVLRYITLPLLKPAIIIAVILRTVDIFRDFDKFYIMTGGGPASSTRVPSLLNYTLIFEQMKAGQGAALSLIMLFIAYGLAKLFVNVALREL